MLDSLSKQKEKEFQLVLNKTVGSIKYILGSMLKLFSTFKAYYLFSCDVVNTAIINIKKNCLFVVVNHVYYGFSSFRNDTYVCIVT